MNRTKFVLLILVALLLALWIEVATHHLNVSLPIRLNQVGVLACSLEQRQFSSPLSAYIVTGKSTFSVRLNDQVLSHLGVNMAQPGLCPGQFHEHGPLLAAHF
jgi:hypothetical protein